VIHKNSTKNTASRKLFCSLGIGGWYADEIIKYPRKKNVVEAALDLCSFYNIIQV
jgi:hypothetical protein